MRRKPFMLLNFSPGRLLSYVEAAAQLSSAQLSSAPLQLSTGLDLIVELDAYDGARVAGWILKIECPGLPGGSQDRQRTRWSKTSRSRLTRRAIRRVGCTTQRQEATA
jgi:hypothetical protein